MNKYISLFVVLTAFCFSASAQVLVSHDKADNLDLSKYKTFKIVKLDIKTLPELEPRQEAIRLLMQEISNNMVTRGFQSTDGEDADLLINLGVTVTEEVTTRETDLRDAPRYVGQRNYSWQSEEIVVGVYKQGTVVMDLVDSEKGEMIWQAVVSSVINEKKREKNNKRITKGVQKLFKKFPA